MKEQGSIWEQVKNLFWRWLIVAVFAGLAVVAVHFVTLPERNYAYATVNYSFDNIEQGLDPDGNRFSADEIKDEDVVRAAAAAVGIEMDDAMVESVQSAIVITGSVPKGTISEITELSSVYTDDDISTTTNERITAYYPTKYTVQFDYKAVGMDSGTGNKFLTAMLEEYKNYFAEEYGYYTAIDTALSVEDYTGYDYDYALDIMEYRLGVLDRYAEDLAEKDQGMFRSATTGYSFADLRTEISTLKTQDVTTLRSYVSSNKVTKNWKELAGRYTYLAEEGTRTKTALQEEIEALQTTINNYVKTEAVVMGSGSSQSGSSTTVDEEGNTVTTGSGSYTVTETSETYNKMVAELIDLQTQLSEQEAMITLYTKYAEQVQENAGSGDTEYVDGQLSALDEKIQKATATLKIVANEYYADEGLEQAFQIVKNKEGKFNIVTLAKAAAVDGVAVEAIVFGVFLLAAVILAAKKNKKNEKTETRPASAET